MDRTFQRFTEVEKIFNSGSLTSVTEMTELAKEKSRLGEVVGFIREHTMLTEVLPCNIALVLRLIDQELAKLEISVLESRDMEQELLDIAVEERNECKSRLEATEDEIIQHYIPKHAEDNSNAILELRPGPGGQEASIFANDILEASLNFVFVELVSSLTV
jgi:peptide chain release factor 1